MSSSKHKRLKLLGWDNGIFQGSVGGGSASSPSSSSFSLEAAIRDGVITKIRLVNFMNHAKLDLSLSPNVNIITGKNGAGKSSILQGIVLGLGGQAKDTKRTSNVSHFVKRDAAKAEIQITLHNDGIESYRKDFFGREIIFERVIHALTETGGKGGSSHVLRKADGEIAYQGKDATEEKHRILDHFHIELDNPISILQQEEAKVFFKVMNEAELFDFFVRATLLKPMQAEYGAANNKLKEAKDQLSQRQDEYRVTKKERDDMSKNLSELRALEEFNETCNLHASALWRHADMKKEEAEKKKAELDRLQTQIKVKEDEGAKLREDLQGMREQHQQADMQNRIAGEKIEEARVEALGEKEAFGATKEELRVCEETIGSIDREIQAKESEKRALHNAMLESKKNRDQKARNVVDRRNKLEEDLKGLEAQQVVCNGEIENLGAQREAFTDPIDRLTETNRQERHALKALESKQQRVQDELRTLRTTTSDDLFRFDSSMPRLVADIEKCNSFRRKPIGPVGRHIKLAGEAAQDSNLADLLETELTKGFLKGFLVDNDQDRKELERLARPHFPNRKLPNICVMSYRGRRDDIRSGQVLSSPPSMPGVLDYLTFENDEVYNYTVEYKKVESTLVLSQADAQRLFNEVGNVPRNARKAITPDFYKFTPAPAYSSYYMEKTVGRQNCLVASQDDNVRRLDNSVSQMAKEIAEHRQILTGNLAKIEEHKEEQERVKQRLEEFRSNVTNIRQKIQQARHNLTLLGDDAVVDYSKEKAEKEEEIRTKREEKAAQVERKRELQRGHDEALVRKNRSLAKWEKLKGKNPDADRLDEVHQQVANKERDATRLASDVAKLRKKALGLERAHDAAVVDQQSAEEKARKKSKGKRMEVDKTLDELQAMDRERKRHMDSKLEDLGMSKEEASKKLSKLFEECAELKDRVSASEELQERTDNMNMLRKAVFDSIRTTISRNVQRKFTMEMKDKGLKGELTIVHQKKEVKVDVCSSLEDDVASLSLQSLSGGERSKTLMCLVIALWTHQHPPFRDVYLDEKARGAVEEMLYTHATTSGFQYIFISPQGSTIPSANVIVIGEK